eukprot:8112833-Karenia_brevis.AAC.1
MKAGKNVPANLQQPKKKKKIFKPCTFEKQGKCNCGNKCKCMHQADYDALNKAKGKGKTKGKGDGK